MTDKTATRSDFIIKLHRLLSDPTHPDDLHWDGDECFRITCEDGRAREALKSAWIFTSLSTFVRQLNYYGFERQSDRRRTAERSGRSRNAGYILFKHPSGNFHRQHPELTERIQRRARKRAPQTGPGQPRANRLGRPIKDAKPRARAASKGQDGSDVEVKVKMEEFARRMSDFSSSGASSLGPPSPSSVDSGFYPIHGHGHAQQLLPPHADGPHIQNHAPVLFPWEAVQQQHRSSSSHERGALPQPHSAPLDNGYFEDQPVQYSSPSESSVAMSPVVTPRYTSQSYPSPNPPAPSLATHQHPSQASAPLYYSSVPTYTRPTLAHPDHATPREGVYVMGGPHQPPAWHPLPAATSAWPATYDYRMPYRVKAEPDAHYARA